MEELKSTGILVNYCGMPLSLGSLMPDNGLANLAGALIQHGHSIIILDYSNLETLEKLHPKILRKIFEIVWRNLMATNSFKKMLASMGLFVLEKGLSFLQIRFIKNVKKDILKIILEKKADYIGFKLWNGDGFYGSIKIAEYIKKKCPKIKIFGGGPHVDIYEENIYQKFKKFDALAYGEGEEIISKLADFSIGLEKLENIPNLIIRKHDGSYLKTPSKIIENLDLLALPVYDEDVYPAMKNSIKLKVFSLDESRGCPNRCAFCNHPKKSGFKRRAKSAFRTVNDFEYLQKKYNAKLFRFSGSNTPVKTMSEIANEIQNRSLKVKFSLLGHVRDADEVALTKIKNAGAVAIFYGIESGSQKILDYLNKKIKVDQIEKAIQFSKNAGLFVIGSFIYPAPFDDNNTTKETLELIARNKLDAIPVQFPGIYLGTPWAENLEKYNFEIPSMKKFINIMMNYKYKNLFPAKFWKPLPYKVNKKRFTQYAKECDDMVAKIENMGFLTNVADDLILIANHIGVQAKEFRDSLKRIFFIGDHDKMKEIIKKI